VSGATRVTTADPSTVRPSLAAAAAENLEALKESLLTAAGSAVKPAWITVECSSCGERSRVEAPVPDVRARVAAIELLLREGLDRPATADEPATLRMPTSLDALREMGWEEMQSCSPPRASARSRFSNAAVATPSYVRSWPRYPRISGTCCAKLFASQRSVDEALAEPV
jgi:hypothetical protein